MPTVKYYELPVIPLKGLIIFPQMVLHFDVGRPKSVAALEQSMAANQKLFLVAQRDPEQEDPTPEELYDVGTIATIKQVMETSGCAGIGWFAAWRGRRWFAPRRTCLKPLPQAAGA